MQLKASGFIFFLYLLLNVNLYSQAEKLENIKNLYKNKEYKKIIEELQKEIENSQELDPQIYSIYSYSLWNLGEKEEALDVLYLSLKRKSSPEVFSQLVKAYSSNFKFKGALEVCEAGLKKFPNDQTLQLQKAYLLARFRKTNEALKLAELLKSTYPNDPKPLVLEAHIYALRQEWDKAQIALEWACSLENKPSYKNNLALVYEKLAELTKEKSKSLEYLIQAKEKLKEVANHSNPTTQENLKRIEEKLSKLQ